MLQLDQDIVDEMPEQQKTKLYLANDLEELRKSIQLPLNSKPNQLVKITSKIYSNALDSYKEGNEEKAYTLYYKYFLAFEFIRNSKEYKKDRVYYDSMMSKKDVKSCVQMLEELSESLEKRYEQKNHEEKLKKEISLAELNKKPKQNGFTTHKNIHINGDKSQEEEENHTLEKPNADHQVIEASQLYALIQEKSTSFLLLDARPSDHYKVCHIKHPSSLNIPEEFLKGGATVKAIERNLHVENRHTWSRRVHADKLILFDWSSEEFKDHTPLMTLKTAMFHFDVFSGTKYKSPAYILKGGFEHFALSYPMWVTNPQKSRPPATNSKKNSISEINLDALEYPDHLNTAFVKTPDNSSVSEAYMSGAITVSNKNMEVVNSPTRNMPKIPDRKSKPSSATSSNSFSASNASSTTTLSSSTTTSGESNLNNAIILNDTTSSSIVMPPKIDRTLKTNMATKMKNISHIDEVLEAENELVEDSLKLEKKEYELEKEWNVLRLRRENELNEEMRQQVLQREEALLAELEKLSIEKSQKDKENEELLKQLDEMKAQLQKKNEDFKLAEKLKENTAKKEQMKEGVEKLRKERIIKQQRLKQEQEKAIQDQILLEQQRRNEEAKRKREETEKAIQAKILHQQQNKVPLKQDGESARRLSRSNSSPNIAKMMDNDGQNNISANIPTPKFDRTSKPSFEVKSRNFNAVWGTSKRGLTGLRNLGNTCYMNSLLQCLSNFTIPSQYFIGENFKNDLNRNSDTRGEIAIEFAEVIRMLWSGQYKSIAPIDFKRTIGKFNEMFRGSDQQDAHELLLILMEFLHQDVNEIRHKVKLPEQNNENIPELEAAQRAWEMEKKADKSFIRETFYGQQRSTLRCPHCGWISVTYESFFELPLKLPNGNKRCSLRQLIETYLDADEVPYKCPTCKRERQCEKRFEIVKLPLILTISLGRFYNDGLSRKKQNFVDFEMTDVNLGQYATGCNGQLNRYKDYQLYGVSNHFGSLESGHYTAYCFSQVYGKWFKYDDTEVYEMEDPNSVKSPAAYILFYSAKN